MIDFLYTFLILMGCIAFTILGLSGKFHFEKKKKSKGDGGW